jgi:hypothetical protein
MIIPEWTDPENSMHPGLDRSAQRLGRTPETGDVYVHENPSEPEHDRAGRPIPR